MAVISKKFDLYETITDTIIDHLEAGTIPWRCRYKSTWRHKFPLNLTSGKPYRGINTILLWVSGIENGFESPYWLTFKQADALGVKVRKGSKSTMIVFWRVYEKENDEGEKTRIPVLRYYRVFNLDQCDIPEGAKLPEWARENEIRVKVDTISECVAVVNGYLDGPEIKHTRKGDAYYSPSADQVVIARQCQFDSDEAYYKTLFHELIHSTGHQSRLDRNMTGQFGNADYAKEELVGEIGSAFLAAMTGIFDDNADNIAAYCNHWIGILRGNKQLIVTAANAAQKAVDRILGA